MRGNAPSFAWEAHRCWRSIERTGRAGVGSICLQAASQDEQFLEEMSDDLISGQRFSRRAMLTFDGENPQVQLYLAVTVLLAVSGFFGLVYNAAGKLALMVTAGAKPGLDSPQGLLIQFLGAVLGTIGFIKLSEGRTERLRKLDGELAFGSMRFQTADGIGTTKKLSELRGKQRVLVLMGTGAEIIRTIRSAAAYRRRWETSGVLVVCVGAKVPPGVAGRWVAEGRNPDMWREAYSLLGVSEGTEEGDNMEPCWVLLGRSGRVRGSGDRGRPDFDQLLAFLSVRDDLSKLPARAVKDNGGAPPETIREVLAVHDAFYEALKEGNITAMQPLWMLPTETSEVKGRVPWDNILSERADVIDVVDVDVVLTSAEPAEVTITSIEVCKGASGLFNEGGPGGKGTLLATKRLRQDPTANGQWRLVSHQTIPYCRNTMAFQSLQCNTDGCILLKRD